MTPVDQFVSHRQALVLSLLVETRDRVTSDTLGKRMREVGHPIDEGELWNLLYRLVRAHLITHEAQATGPANLAATVAGVAVLHDQLEFYEALQGRFEEADGGS